MYKYIHTCSNVLLHAYKGITSKLTQVSCGLIACSLILLLSCRKYSIENCVVDMHTFMYTDSTFHSSICCYGFNSTFMTSVNSRCLYVRIYTQQMCYLKHVCMCTHCCLQQCIHIHTYIRTYIHTCKCVFAPMAVNIGNNSSFVHLYVRGCLKMDMYKHLCI